MAPTVSGLTLDSASVVGGTSVQGTITLAGTAGPSGYTVQVRSSDYAAANPPYTVVVPSGTTQVTFTVPTLAVATDRLTTITVKTPTSVASAPLTVSAPVLQSISATPATVKGIQVSTGTVTLSGPAPIGGLTVTVASDQSAAKPPSTVKVRTGETSVTFAIYTDLVGADVKATLTATLGAVTRSTVLNVVTQSVAFFIVDTNQPISGSDVTGTIGLDIQAPVGGVTIALSSDKIFASVPPTVTVPEGAYEARFRIRTSGIDASDAATITARGGGQEFVNRLDVLAQGLSDWSCPGGNPQHTGLATGPAAVGQIAWGTPGSSPTQPQFVFGLSKYGRVFGIRKWRWNFDLIGSTAQDGNVQWGRTFPAQYDSMPVMGIDGSIFVCSDQIIYAMNCQSGAERWRIGLPGLGLSTLTSPVVGPSGTVYLAGHGPNDLGFDESVVVALDGQTGALLWKKLLGTPGGAPKQPSVGRDGTVYVALADGTVDALYPLDGSIKWSNPLGGPTQAPSIGFDGSVYIQMNTGVLYRLANQDGAKLWSYLEKSFTALSRWPLIGPDGTVYIGATNLYAINPTNGAERWHVHLGTKTSAFGIASEGTVYAKADTLIYALNKLDGSVKWSLDIGNTQTLPVIGSDGILNYGTFAIR
ncbi:cell surface protein [Fimbriimonas ginsengisoli Gsoil 348]|uniref:Cell surface protein n=2 Tax=Fimbriimonas ginsengisoli TaxID=1005039 RepID=A0A068NXM1_FIMGI|nr:cell surface protein [Fimbriimonas ginsengisoli Gsoil 348]